MEELIALIGGGPATAEVLGSLLETRIGKVVTLPFRAFEEAASHLSQFGALVLLDLRPDRTGDIADSAFEYLSRFGSRDGAHAKLTIICTVHIDNPVFVTALTRVPGRVSLVDQTKADWARVVLRELETHFRDVWLERSLLSFFEPGDALDAAPQTVFHPSTHLALLKWEVHADRVGEHFIPKWFQDSKNLRVRTKLGQHDPFDLYWRGGAQREQGLHLTVRGVFNSNWLKVVRKVAESTVELLTGSDLQFPKPKHKIEIVVADMYPMPRQASAFLETRSFNRDSGEVLYVPSQLMTSPKWSAQVREQVARALLRGTRTTLTPRGSIFEEALAKWALDQTEFRIRGVKEEPVRPVIAIDSPRNSTGVRALIDYFSQILGGRFPIRLWDLGEDGLLQAAHAYFARPLEAMLEEFFWWAFQESRLMMSTDLPPPSLRWLTFVDHASYWLGQAVQGGELQLHTHPIRPRVRAYAVPLKPCYQEAPLRNRRLAGRLDESQNFLVLNLGTRHRSEFSSHDRVRWWITRGAAESPPPTMAYTAHQ